jgi:hypothetical protein
MFSLRMLLGSTRILGKIHPLVFRNKIINIRKGTDKNYNKIAKDNLAYEKRTIRKLLFWFM